MRILLTLIALALVAVLSAALLAPLFIDWPLHRVQIEGELSEVLGARVVVSGPIDIGFLPTPYIQVENVKISDGNGDDAAAFTCDRLRLEASLASLPSGRAHFTLARLDHPVVTLARGAGGSVRPPQWRFKARADRVSLDRVVVTDGRLRVLGGEAALDVAGLDIDATAASLVGPYRGSGRVGASGAARAEFRFATGALANAALPVKLEIDEAAGLPSGVFDGLVTLTPNSADDGVDLAYSGSGAVSGVAPMGDSEPPAPWSVVGALRADFSAANLDNLVARFGPDERALEASGAARLEMGAHAGLTADLKAKELNVDALLRRDGEDFASPARALAVLGNLLSPLKVGAGAPLALRLAFATPTVIVGAQTLSDVSLNATAVRGAPIEGELALGLPGDSTLRLSGALELGSAAQFKGQLEANLGDFAQLRDWASKDEPDVAQRLSALQSAFPYRKASAKGDVEISAVGFSARNLQFVVDRTALSGAMAFTRPLGEERGRLFMDLRGDALDVDALPNLSASADLVGDIDLSVALEAAKLRVARVGEAAIDSGSLSLKVTKSGSEFSLDRFSVAGLGGAAIEARGASGSQGRWLSVQLNTDKLRDFAAMIGRVAPGPLSRSLMQRAGALSPAKATFEARGAGARPNGGGVFDSVRAQGSAGQTQFAFKAERSPETGGGVAATLTLDAAEGGALLRQFGVGASSVSSGRARIDASANGWWDTGFDAHVEASLAGANLAWRGRLKPEASGDDTPLFGAATMKADNVMPLLVALGLGGPAAAMIPVDLAADLVVRGADVRLPRLIGTVAGAKISGQLNWRPAVEPGPDASIDADVALARSIAGETPTASRPQIDGELVLDRASLAALLSLPLGAQQATKPGAKWSDARFGSPLLDPPAVDVRLTIGALDIADGLQGRAASARMKTEKGRFDIAELAMDVAGGRAAGQVTIRRDGPVATLEGQASFDPTPVDRASVRGRLGAALAFASTGQSASALVAGMVGEGQVQTSGLAIPRLDPGALARVIAKAQMPDARIDETNVTHALGLEFDKQAMDLPDGAMPAVMSAGVVHIGPYRSSAAGGSATASGDFDLRTQELTIRAAFAAADGGKFWSGPPPSIAVTLSGPVDAPTRQIDASALVAGLAAQAIARESDRIASLEADIRERAYFNRRLKAEQFMRQREAELAAFAAEQARIKSEEDRKRVEDELLKASEAQEKAATPVAPPVGPPKPAPEPLDPTASGIY